MVNVVYTVGTPKCLHKVPDRQPYMNLVPMLLQQNPQNVIHGIVQTPTHLL